MGVEQEVEVTSWRGVPEATFKVKLWRGEADVTVSEAEVVVDGLDETHSGVTIPAALLLKAFALIGHAKGWTETVDHDWVRTGTPLDRLWQIRSVLSGAFGRVLDFEVWSRPAFDYSGRWTKHRGEFSSWGRAMQQAELWIAAREVSDV
jgi:hypothetical protein